MAEEIVRLVDQRGIGEFDELEKITKDIVAPIAGNRAGSGLPGPAALRAGRVSIVPKGLRSFDAVDSDFFLELLPGPRDENGLPESLRFWKYRIEAVDELAFTVGVIFGPSGCGKSSLVKAGLLPRLAPSVVSIYIEATGEETEARLLRGLRRRFPDLAGDLGLAGTLAALRQGQGLGQGQHLLIVLDQFEQWLQARRRDRDPELARALRQCDGDHVQCIVMVRDDFWVAMSRFMADLHIDILQGRNAALVDLFDLIHARKVLTEIGKAYGRLPREDGLLSKDQESFLTQAIEGLAQDGRVVPVRLALFAEMVKSRPWSPATLKEIGGTQGVGVSFLEETFGSPTMRIHQRAAQSVLRALLPESGTNILGLMRSYDDLIAASGYTARPSEFEHLLRTLDQDVRLITPTDAEGTDTEGTEQPVPAGQYYQLTHDYLVPSIRDWLSRKQRETRRGRAELRLAERTALWSARPENRYLPSAFEWATIRLLTKQREWTQPQRRMMRRAGRVHGLRALGLALLAGLLTWGRIEVYGSLRASALVESLLMAGTPDVPPLVQQLSEYRRWTDPRLRQLLHDSDPGSRAHLHASLALLDVDPAQVDYLWNRLLMAGPTELPVLREALRPHRAQLVPKLWAELETAQAGEPRLLACAGVLALCDPENPRWAELSGKVAEALVTENSLVLGPWLEALRPVSGKLIAPLALIFRDKQRPQDTRAMATDILAGYAADEPGFLAGLLLDADPKAFGKLFPIAERQAAKVLPLFQAELAKGGAGGKEEESESLKDARAERQARAAVALVRLGHAEEVWPLLRHSADPRLRSFIVNWLRPLGADPKAVTAALARLDSPPQHQAAPPKVDAIRFHPETSMRRALILALGTYGTKGLSPSEREPLIGKLLDLYQNDPDAGIHAAAEWTLWQWEQQAQLREVDAKFPRFQDRGNRRWYVNGQGQTFALVEGPVEFRMGSPPTEPDRGADETPHHLVIPRGFAIAAKEVTVEKYQRFARENSQFGLAKSYLDKYSPEPNGPMIAVNWFDAAAYCNWLSQHEGLPKDR
jgi:hypothetical protein